MKEVVCIGAANVDVLKYVDRFCEPDEEVPINNIEVCSGGQAGNIASAMGKLGHKPYFFGHIGNDNYTQMLQKDFEEANVNHSHAPVSNLPNNTVHCIIDTNGDRQLYAYNTSGISAKDFPDELYSAHMIIFTSLPQEKAIEEYTQIAKKAKENNVEIALVPSSLLTKKGLDNLKPLLQHTDYLIASEKEINELLESREISELNVPHIAITHGSKGASIVTNDKRIKAEAKKSNVIDSTGAGDNFAAAFLTAVLEEKGFEQALEFANHAASLSVQKKGARAMPRRDELEGLSGYTY